MTTRTSKNGEFLPKRIKGYLLSTAIESKSDTILDDTNPKAQNPKLLPLQKQKKKEL